MSVLAKKTIWLVDISVLVLMAWSPIYSQSSRVCRREASLAPSSFSSTSLTYHPVFYPLLFSFMLMMQSILSPSTAFKTAKPCKCDFDALTAWSKKWNLSFNVEKCASMSCYTTSNSSHLPHVFHIDGQQVSPNDTVKDLGVIMTKNMDWSTHHQYILAKAYRMLNLLRRTFCVDNSHSGKKVLYLTLVRSWLTYCSPIWRPHLLRDISALEKLQRRAIKYILK